MLRVLYRFSPLVRNLIKEHKQLMADVSQLTADLADLQSAVAEDQAAISSVTAYAQAQAAEILNLERQVATFQAQGGAGLDLSQLESSIAALKQQNQLLASIGAAADPSSAPPAADQTADQALDSTAAPAVTEPAATTKPTS